MAARGSPGPLEKRASWLGRRRAGAGDGVVGVFHAQARVHGDRGGGACTGCGRDERPRVGAVAGGVDAVDRRCLAWVDRDRAVVVEPAAHPAGDVVAKLPADVEEERIAVERLSVIQAKAPEAALVAVQRDDGRLDDRDVEGLHTRELIHVKAMWTVAEQDNVSGPLAQQDGEVFAA